VPVTGNPSDDYRWATGTEAVGFVITAVIVEKQAVSEVARTYGITRSWALPDGGRRVKGSPCTASELDAGPEPSIEGRGDPCSTA